MLRCLFMEGSILTGLSDYVMVTELVIDVIGVPGVFLVPPKL